MHNLSTVKVKLSLNITQIIISVCPYVITTVLIGTLQLPVETVIDWWDELQ